MKHLITPTNLNCGRRTTSGLWLALVALLLFPSLSRAQYCVPTQNGFGTTDGDFIAGVQLGSINNPSGPAAAPYYEDYTSLSTSLNRGKTVTISLTNGTYADASSFFAVFIDYDQNLDFFGADEMAAIVTANVPNGVVTGTFTIPATATLGATRMRIRRVWDNSGSPTIDPCADYDYGESEDYTVVISSGPVANFTSNVNIVAAGGSVDFTNLSTNAPNALWTFVGAATPSSTAFSPTGIVYNTPGTYAVRLVAANAALTESDTMTVASFITVVPAPTCSDLFFPTQNPVNYVTGQGFFPGHTGLPSLLVAEYANYYNVGGTGLVNSASLLFTKAVSLSPNTSSITVRLYDDDGAANAPGTVLGSTTVPYSTIIADVNSSSTTLADFGASIPVAGGFYVSFIISYTPNTDTLGLASEQAGTVPYNSGFFNFNGSWTSASSVLSGNPNTRFSIYANYCPAPLSGPIADFAANVTVTTVGEPVRFTDLSTGTPTSWTWSVSPLNVNLLDGTTASDQNPAVEFTQPGLYTVTLTATNAGGSDSETKTAYILVNPAPTCDTLHFPTPIPSGYVAGADASSGYIPGHNTALITEYADFYTGTSGQPFLNGAYFWFNIAKSNTPATSFITAKVYDATGAGSTPGNVLAQQNITYQTLMDDIANNRFTFADFGGSVPLSGPYFIGYEITYAPGDTIQGVVDQMNNPIVNSSYLNFPGFGWVSVPTALSTSGVTSAQQAIYPIVGPAPVAKFTASATSVCKGKTVTFTNTSDNSNNLFWIFPGGNPQTSNAQSVTVQYDTVGTYDVVLYISGSCAGFDSTLVVDQVTVSDAPVADFGINPNPVCQGVPATVSFIGINAPGSTFAWNFAGGVATPGTGVGPHQVVWSNAGTKTIQLILTNAAGCSDTVTHDVTVNPGLVAPTVSCGTATQSSVTFTWSDLGAGVSYQVSVNGAAFTVPNNGAGARTHVVGSLAPSTSVTIVVRGIGGGVGSCSPGASSTLLTCTSLPPAGTNQLLATVFLQGAYRSGSMINDLNTGGVLPAAQPYNAAPYNYNGAETNAAFPVNVVDWVLVELRDAVDIFNVVERRAGVVLTDGTLRAADGVSPLTFSSAAGNYTVTIKHRSHLSLTSANPVALPNSSTLDLSAAANIAGGSGFAADLGGGRFGLVAGDLDSDGFITATDYTIWQTDNSLFFQYLDSDMDMDVFVTAQDYILWIQNNTKFSYID